VGRQSPLVRTLRRRRPPQQLRQLGDVGGDAPRFVFRQQVRRRIYGCSARIKRPGDAEASLAVAVARVTPAADRRSNDHRIALLEELA
jgi:hypothetical protein